MEGLTQWDVFLVISTLVGFAIAIGTPVIKLNASITKLIFHIDSLDKGFMELDQKNQKSHERMWYRIDEHGKAIEEHEKRIFSVEQKKGERK